MVTQFLFIFLVKHILWRPLPFLAIIYRSHGKPFHPSSGVVLGTSKTADAVFTLLPDLVASTSFAILYKV